MKLKFFILVIGVILLALLNPVSALNITAEASYSSINYTFEPALDTNATIYFNNEQIFTPTTDNLLVTDLEANQLYPLVVLVDGVSYSDITSTTTNPSSLPYYLATFGVIIIVMCILYLGRDVPYSGYIAALIAMGGLFYVIKAESDFIIILAHVLTFFVAGILAAQQEAK